MPKKATSKLTPPPQVLRAASYCRTSGEGQRDNTSIPRQRDDNEAYIEVNGWQFTEHYVDECRSGSKEEGRTSFQRMLRDAANSKFHILVVYDIKRFSRDGADIIRNAELLRTNWNIHVVDTKNQFDTRNRRNTLINYVHAGASEQERLDIMERMIGGRIKRAMDGLPWAGHRPFGRDYRKEKKGTGEWYVTERGESMRKLLTRYADGAILADICKEYGFSSSAVVLQTVRVSQLSGPYCVTFNTPEIGVVDLKVPIPAMPEVITPELERRVRLRMDRNRTWNKDKLKKYLLTGYIFCEHCGRALTSATCDGYVYYRHHCAFGGGKGCPFASVGARLADPHALGYLYRFFLDEPAFNEAIKQALPCDEDRAALAQDIAATRARLGKVNAEIANLVNAIAGGADIELLLDKQKALKARKQATQASLQELEDSLAALPSVSLIENQAKLLRLQLCMEHYGKDWRKLSFDDIRRFLCHLFGDDAKKTGHGIFVRREGKTWTLTFKGLVTFHHQVVDGRVRSEGFDQLAATINETLAADYHQAVKCAAIKPDMVKSFAK